jgi:hypothetical protein
MCLQLVDRREVDPLLLSQPSLVLGPSRVEPRTRTTILEIKFPKPLLRAQEAAPGTPTARHLCWRTPTTKLGGRAVCPLQSQGRVQQGDGEVQ